MVRRGLRFESAGALQKPSKPKLRAARGLGFGYPPLDSVKLAEADLFRVVEAGVSLLKSHRPLRTKARPRQLAGTARAHVLRPERSGH
jgi:hypothetical protein